MKHLKKAFCLLLAAVMLLALGVPVMAAGEIPVDAEHFPDATLRTYVTDYCDTNKDNKLSAAECAAVQCIDLFEMQITKVADMTGIEHFTNLRELLACNNQITTLDLSGMTKLEKLDVSGCDKLQSLKLAGCTALTSLDASSCALTALDLTGCTALKTVACSYNDLTALDVSAAEKLTTLECSANRLTALDLSGHKALKVLTCSLNDLAALELTGCTALESLDCSDNALAALDLKLRKDMQQELKNIQKATGITFVFVTHDQEEALSMSDTIVVMSEGKIQQIGTPLDIYNEPQNAFVADFIGESNIVDGIMRQDFRVTFSGHTFTCVDKGFAKNENVDVVIRPEDVDIVPIEKGMLRGTVTSVTFMGVHYEIIIDINGFKWMIQTTDYVDEGAEVGLYIEPDAIHIMKKSEYSGMYGDYSSFSNELDELSDAESEPDE